MPFTHHDYYPVLDQQTIKIHYTQWGNPANQDTLFCAHGYVRNCRDFDAFATQMSQSHRLICVDMPGRGHSDWIDPARYTHDTYTRIALSLLNHLQIERTTWLGTSMGGMTGIHLAANHPSRIKRLILNDVGARVDRAGIRFLKTYMDGDLIFNDLEAAEAYFRHAYQAFGDISDNDWRHMAKHGVMACESGGYRLHFDPVLAEQALQMPDQDINVFELWHKVVAPTLILHGKESLYLSHDTIEEMQTSQAETQAIHFEGIGHVPTLTTEAQIDVINQWLCGGHITP